MELLHPLTKWTSPQLCATVEAAVSERKVLQTVVSARAADGGAAPTAFFLSLAPFDYHRTQLWAVMLVALGGDALSWNSGAGATSPISPRYLPSISSISPRYLPISRTELELRRGRGRRRCRRPSAHDKGGGI